MTFRERWRWKRTWKRLGKEGRNVTSAIIVAAKTDPHGDPEVMRRRLSRAVTLHYQWDARVRDFMGIPQRTQAAVENEPHPN